MPLETTPVARPELLARLALGHAARTTVLTPNRRLARALEEAFAGAQRAAGRGSWEAADILPIGAFAARLWDDARHSDRAPGLPTLLAASQEQALWEEAIGASRIAAALLSTTAAATQCREAWALAHRWRLADRLARHDSHEDARAFLDWAGRYQRATGERRLLDAARLPDALLPLLAERAVRAPACVALFGFDLLDPQQETLVAALQAAGTELLAARNPACASQVRRVAFDSPREELAAAARWARTRLEAHPGARIGIVVPDLAQSRAAVARALQRVLHPGRALEPAARAPLAFELSLGTPLDAQPLVHDALLALRAGGRTLAFEEASRLLRSPFLAGADQEAASRARADARLRERAGAEVSLEALLRLLAAEPMPPLPILRERLERLAAHRKAALFGAHAAGEWARAFTEALRLLGFPGERSLDSLEHQALEKWHEALAALAALEQVTGRMGFGEALGRLARIARDALFQTEAPQVPVQVLGVLESAGLEFDHLWVLGLTEEAWPMPPRPNPFVPLRLQREAGIPNADPVAALELDRRLTHNWLAAAGEVVLSHARLRDDSAFAASPLVAAIPLAPLADLGLREYPALREAIHAGGVLERLADERAAPLADARHRGGTAIFRDQAACPFRAFARHRLASEGLESPQPGLDARDRGTLLHEMLRAVWGALGSKAALDACAAPQLEAILAASAAEAIARMRRRRRDALDGRFAQAEQRRLVEAARAWLAIERRRAPFQVVEREAPRPLAFGGLAVEARIDRIDALESGGEVVIDYKGGAASAASWLGERPEEPQLPMYALGGGDVRAIAFARLKPGVCDFHGLAAEDGLVPGVCTVAKSRARLARRYSGWDDLRAAWQRELDALGRGFREGDARADPRRGARTCERCDQQMLCRVAERGDEAGEP